MTQFHIFTPKSFCYGKKSDGTRNGKDRVRREANQEWKVISSRNDLQTAQQDTMLNMLGQNHAQPLYHV